MEAPLLWMAVCHGFFGISVTVLTFLVLGAWCLVLGAWCLVLLSLCQSSVELEAEGFSRTPAFSL